MFIRETKKEELDEILKLVLRSFMKYVAPTYSKEGIDEFKKFISNESAISTLKFYSAYENDELLGTIATRENNTHISLFFIDEKYIGKGIGKKLYECINLLNETGLITVNSSPYAVEIYKSLGFIPASNEKIENGIRFTPMKSLLKRNNLSFFSYFVIKLI